MVAEVRCKQIKLDQLASFSDDQAWLSLGQEAAAGLVPAFGSRAGDLAGSCIAGCVGRPPIPAPACVEL